MTLFHTSYLEQNIRLIKAESYLIIGINQNYNY